MSFNNFAEPINRVPFEQTLLEVKCLRLRFELKKNLFYSDCYFGQLFLIIFNALFSPESLSSVLCAQGGLRGLDEADRGPGDRERPSRSFGPRFADQERLGIGSEPDDDDDDHFVKFGRKDAASSPGKKLLLDLF